MSRGEAPTVVITGASAGVGRATALAFARRGWNVALLARDPTGLESAGNEVDQAGGRALLIPADVADENTIFTASEQVIKHWGTIDVWVNNAMVTMFAPLADISPAEFRRITEVTYLGYVFGTMAALKHMRLRNAGTIVQVGSALAYRAIPLQSAYCGAKFAIRGFTDALRSELQHEKSAIRITMVQLPAVNTPQFDWARNKMGRRPQPMPPIHQPEAIAEIIFRVSQEPPREFWVGFASVRAILGTMLAPGLLERFLARKGYEGQLTAEAPPPDLIDNLFEAAPSGHAIRGPFDDHANARVLSINPAILRTATTVVATTVAAAAAVMAVALFG
jgi:NAD(P)-dependent dehydrogenase (short-subunit alcohol dehydrogenase family)